ncbi:type II CAAX prenyl endopeptidase Rce1 family protein [Lactobacillus paragasseri]|uniref:CPBP family glutamic-type intramembrane protease n=1 Tax=Lactobacillus paragasseri TaxID=2107999 RepID=UPI00055661CE
MFLTFGLGCYLAVIFLYTGKLWIVILFHIFYDTLVFSITPLGISGSLILSRISYTMMVTIGWLFLAAIVFILNKKIIKENIILLTERRNEKIIS